MTRSHRYLIGIGLTLAVAGVYSIYFSQGKQKVETVSLEGATDQKAVQDAIQAAGEKAYKKAYLAPLIATYEKVLVAAPNSLELQKKLASAYLEIGDTAKARPLLEKLARSKDPEAGKYKEQLRNLQ